jgi:hypothetical protein
MLGLREEANDGKAQLRTREYAHLVRCDRLLATVCKAVIGDCLFASSGDSSHEGRRAAHGIPLSE